MIKKTQSEANTSTSHKKFQKNKEKKKKNMKEL
jgi:hypothetical protein